MPQIDAPVIVWFRADLRLHDHPALAAAVASAGTVVPVFILDRELLTGPSSSSNRNRFLLECLKDLRASLKKRGGDIVIREGDAKTELPKLIDETGARAVYYIEDYTPYAVARDNDIAEKLQRRGVAFQSFSGALITSSLHHIQTKSGSPFKVFTPFWKEWSRMARREVAEVPEVISTPTLEFGSLPTLTSITRESELSPDVPRGGEMIAHQRLHEFLDSDIEEYANQNNDMGADVTSRLSPYLHFGCLSVREIESMLPDTEGARAWHRQLAWRDFYYYILFHNPHPDREFQERYRGFPWDTDPALLDAWKQGRTGYPVVDAALRQLKQEGWMHNRGRLIVGSFLTKDLGIDWREGERHFMHWLIDGDTANNNGNWQWIASVGVDPAPVARRLYNPSLQRDRYDPRGHYVRKYVPELARVPDTYLSEPWTMPLDVQNEVGCVIGKDYPAPIVDHKEARRRALERYYSV